MRERIIYAFAELSRSKGFYRITMDELAKKAGLSKRTLYRYFTGKEEVIEAVIDNLMNKMSLDVEAAVSVEKPAEIFNMILNAFQKNSSQLNPLVMEDLRLHYPQFWQKIDHFRLEKAEKMIKLLLNKQNTNSNMGLDSRIVTTAVIAGIQAVLNPEFLYANNLTIDTTAPQLLKLFMNGFIQLED